MKKIGLAVAMLFILVGCATVTPVYQSIEHKKSTSFDIGKTQKSNLGSAMVVEEDLFFYDGLVATADFTPPKAFGITYPVIKAKASLKTYGQLNSGDILYEVLNYKAKIYNGDPVAWNYCIILNTDGKAYGDTACSMAVVRKWTAPVNSFKKSKIYTEGSLKRELLYNGKAGNTIKLTYREYKDDFARPAFYQDLSYDLSESNIIGYKKMQIEIIKATNSYIQYIVRSSME